VVAEEDAEHVVGEQQQQDCGYSGRCHPRRQHKEIEDEFIQAHAGEDTDLGE